MRNFTYHVPTEIVFGADTEKEAGRLCRKYGGRRVLVVSGGGSAQRSGLLDRLCDYLAQAGCAAILFEGAQPNPVVSHAQEGVALAQREKIDMILNVIHAESLSAMWTAWGNYVCNSHPDRFAQLGQKVFGLSGDNLTHRTIRRVQAYFRELGMPVSLSELGIPPQEATRLAKCCSHNGEKTIGVFQTLHKQDMEQIYAAAYEE